MNKVANEKFVSHQSVSQHIIRLEKQLNVKLFYRKPKLLLTTEGEILFHGLKQLKAAEDKLIFQISDANINRKGKLRVGMPSSHSPMIVPLLLPAFRKIYRNVDVEVVSGLSDNLETMTLNGELDLFFGTDKMKSDRLTAELLFTEKLFFVIGDEALKNVFEEEQITRSIEKLKQGVNIMDFKSVPLVLTPPPSRLRRMIDAIAEKNGCQLDVAFETNDINMSIKLCQDNPWACVVQQLIIDDYAAYRKTALSGLNYFPLLHVDGYHGDLSIVYLKDLAPRYQTDFIAITKKVFHSLINKIRVI